MQKNIKLDRQTLNLNLKIINLSDCTYFVSLIDVHSIP